ncbi:uncharacterized protein LOC131663048 [Phymastichus coffea]|uniref:uncharacterized protein LOC131663048 n=1 Tax=Phymastichus coffea TaxID=108790 RepID=UPI00273B62C9|nr:uncharacterized protein LOC131663048 [Phymastichus coffea]
MSRVSMAKLADIQKHRVNEIVAIGNRIKERAPETLNAAIIQTRINTVSDLWHEIRKTHHEITMRNDSTANSYMTENTYDAMQQLYEETHDWLLTTLTKFQGLRELNTRRRARDADDNDDDDETSVKLPRLELPTFSGKYEDWGSFADQFSSIVHDAPRISNTTKLRYLKSCLRGPAGDLVKDVPILGVNYEPTWAALKERFHNPRLTINNLIDSFLNLPHLKRESAVDLRAFADDAQRIVRALTTLRAPVAHWDLWLVHIVEIRLDPESRKQWEAEMSVKDRQPAASTPDHEDDHLHRMPKFVELSAFLERRAHSLSAIQSTNNEKATSQPQRNNNSSRRVHHVHAEQPEQPVKTVQCPFCTESHYLSRCPTYLAKKVYDRQSICRRLGRCFNCLGPHKFNSCKSNGRCKTCNEKHHSSLHFDKRTKGKPNDNATNPTSDAPAQSVRSNVAQVTVDPTLSINSCNANSSTSPSLILLATAQVIVIGPTGKQTRARVLLYQGSEATFVSDALVQLLGLPRDRVRTGLTGVGGCKAGVVNSRTIFALRSRVDAHFELEVSAFVLPRLTENLPARSLIEFDLGPFEGLSLADPDFHLSDRVDIMIGADLYGQLLCSGLKTFPSTLLVAQNTALGWVISGPAHSIAPRRAVAAHNASVTALRCAIHNDFDEAIERFWKIEEVSSPARTLNPDDEAAEKLFDETHSRDKNGRFVVRLPLKAGIPSVALETRRIALGSLKHQALRFSRDSNLALSYSEFMETYIHLGYMVPIPQSEINNPHAWYLPHHAVVQGDPGRSKIRVVFDASRRTREQFRLNDFLRAGPALQGDLALILLNWRRYRYVFTADIVKMFRQIRIAPEDQDLHRIL